MKLLRFLLKFPRQGEPGYGDPARDWFWRDHWFRGLVQEMDKIDAELGTPPVKTSRFDAIRALAKAEAKGKLP